MTKGSNRRKTVKEETLTIPAFRSREEESEWFDDNGERLMELVSRYGKAVPPRQVANRLLTMRIPISDIEQAQQIAAKEGVGYQTVLKRAIREGLKRAV